MRRGQVPNSRPRTKQRLFVLFYFLSARARSKRFCGPRKYTQTSRTGPKPRIAYRFCCKKCFFGPPCAVITFCRRCLRIAAPVGGSPRTACVPLRTDRKVFTQCSVLLGGPSTHQRSGPPASGSAINYYIKPVQHFLQRHSYVQCGADTYLPSGLEISEIFWFCFLICPSKKQNPKDFAEPLDRPNLRFKHLRPHCP